MKYVFLTGASSDIGTQIATTLSKTYPLLLCGREEKSLDKILPQLDPKQPHQKLLLDCNQIATIKPQLQNFLGGGGDNRILCPLRRKFKFWLYQTF
ncbi:hypothetical protein [Helicobacter sp. 11S03491-1]|uniref:hypothetical protein n=1 Tax=Helicobacter sp. 11S03491-1 TaxID=1476196 RepID=UPI000BA4E807|nr:hypothetical protein [Helicobacter sp. 11S03491-1]